MSAARQSAPLSSLPVEHLRPEDAYRLGWEDCERTRDQRELEEEGMLITRPMRELDRLLDRVDAVEPVPRWRPRESEDLLAVASAVGVLRDEAA